jgi:hypothetical protein
MYANSRHVVWGDQQHRCLTKPQLGKYCYLEGKRVFDQTGLNQEKPNAKVLFLVFLTNLQPRTLLFDERCPVSFSVWKHSRPKLVPLLGYLLDRTSPGENKRKTLPRNNVLARKSDCFDRPRTVQVGDGGAEDVSLRWMLCAREHL